MVSLMNQQETLMHVPRLAVDGIVHFPGSKKTVLIRRKGKTFHGRWAIPGGIVEVGEQVEDTLSRELFEEIGVDVVPVDILGVYSDPSRDPRGHVVSVVFVCRIVGGALKAGSDASYCQVWNLDDGLPSDLAFDHEQILEDYKKWFDFNRTYWSSRSPTQPDNPKIPQDNPKENTK